VERGDGGAVGCDGTPDMGGGPIRQQHVNGCRPVGLGCVGRWCAGRWCAGRWCVGWWRVGWWRVGWWRVGWW
jgi:hypothetical protein